MNTWLITKVVENQSCTLTTKWKRIVTNVFLLVSVENVFQHKRFDTVGLSDFEREIIVATCIAEASLIETATFVGLDWSTVLTLVAEYPTGKDICKALA